MCGISDKRRMIDVDKAIAALNNLRGVAHTHILAYLEGEYARQKRQQLELDEMFSGVKLLGEEIW